LSKTMTAILKDDTTECCWFESNSPHRTYHFGSFPVGVVMETPSRS
jgi:hypothetical protein